VVYRKPDAERTHEERHRTHEARRRSTRERVAWLAIEIGRIDALLGEWSTAVPDGAPAPPEAVDLMLDKEALETELRALASAADQTGPLEPVEPLGPPGPSPSLGRAVVRWLGGRRQAG
jgi:hypothetical protein